MDKQIARACVLVKAYPQPSQHYEKTVCCAAITDSGKLRRIYPVPYRRFRPEQKARESLATRSKLDNDKIDRLFGGAPSAVKVCDGCANLVAALFTGGLTV